MDLFLLDSCLSSVSLSENPYLPAAFGRQMDECKKPPPTGIYLTLHGRGADGRSVTVETALSEGLSIAFLLDLTTLETSEDADADDAADGARLIIEELVGRCQQELSADDLEGRVLLKPCCIPDATLSQ